MSRFAQGIFAPKNPKKYVGKHNPKWRSSWEMVFMNFLDQNENILYWASEAISIPYIHPFTQKRTMYIPDFFVVYQNKNGQRIAEVVEIKPKKQSVLENKNASQRERATIAINHAKWDSASKWCKLHGYTFRVITEDQIFHQGKKK